MEIPSVQISIRQQIDESKLEIIGVHTQASKDWLMNYVQRKNLSFPMISGGGELMSLYHIGWSYGNNTPSYFIIDKNGIIKNRFDGATGIIPQIKAEIEKLIN